MRFNKESIWQTSIFNDIVERRTEKYNPSKNNQNLIDIELESLSSHTGELLTTFDSRKQKSTKNIFYPKDILYGKLRPYLRKFYFSNFKGCCSTEIWVLHSTIINNSYLYQYIQSDKFNTLANLTFGSKMPRADWDIISNSEISYPDMHEQEKVALFLSEIDERIQTQSKIIELKQSLIKDIEDKILWKSTNTHTKPIREFLTEINEKSIIQNQYPLLSSTKKGLFLQADYFNKEAASSNNIGYKIVHKGDIIISPQNLWMGNITYNDKFDNGLVSPSYRIYKVKEEYNAFYISRILMSYRALSLYKNISEQGASIVRRNLNIDAFNELCFPIPDIKKQDEVGLFLSKLHQELNSEIEILRQLKNQKKYLLCNMFI